MDRCNLKNMPAELDTIAFRLFKLFAQYEYALKVMGFVKATKTGAAEPDWDRFAKEVGRDLLNMDEPSIVKAREYLLSEPPKRQVFSNGKVIWADVDNKDKSVNALFGHIRRVRNNLYHGGKFNHQWFAPERSLPLMKATIILLSILREKNASLDEAITSNAA
jgi:hypothetical protein